MIFTLTAKVGARYGDNINLMDSSSSMSKTLDLPFMDSSSVYYPMGFGFWSICRGTFEFCPRPFPIPQKLLDRVVLTEATEDETSQYLFRNKRLFQLLFSIFEIFNSNLIYYYFIYEYIKGKNFWGECINILSIYDVFLSIFNIIIVKYKVFVKDFFWFIWFISFVQSVWFVSFRSLRSLITFRSFWWFRLWAQRTELFPSS